MIKKNLKRKYIATSTAAFTAAVVACAAGVNARDMKIYDANETSKYAAGVVSSAATTEEATETDADDTISEDELIDKLTSGTEVSEKDIYKDETVYAFANASGTVDSVLVNEVLKNSDGASTLTDKTDLKDIENVKGDETYTQDGDTITWEANGNDITYQGTTDKELPVNVSVTYTLDGKTVTPEELAGKSGKVTMRFQYTNTASVEKEINGKTEDVNVPFVAITGMVLGDNFTNISVENGKSIAQGDSNIVIGFGMPGLMDSIKASSDDFSEDVDVPDYCEVTADVTDFSLDMTATVVVDGSAMNISGELDLSSMDELMTELSDSTDQLVDGSSELSDGIATLLEKMGEFNSGVGTLKAGIDTLSTKSSALITGIGTIDASANSISDGISALDQALNTPMSDEAKAAAYQTAYDTASTAAASTIDSQSSTIAENAASTVTSQFTTEGGTYDTIKDTVNNKIDAMLNDETTATTLAQAATSAATTAATNAVTQAGVTSAVTTDSSTTQAATALVTAMVATGKITQAEAAQYVQALELASASAAAKYAGTTAGTAAATAAATTVQTGITNAIKNADMGTQVADTSLQVAQTVAEQVAVSAAKSAATTAAGTAAGTAAVQGAEAAKSQIASQIEATQANGYSLVTGAAALASGTSTMNDAAPTLADGIAALKSGASTLANGSTQLVSGVSTISDGAKTLADGMQTYDTEAISKIVNSYNGDVKSLVERLSAVASASSEYDTFTMHEDGVGATTKFIIKTAGISAED